MTVVSAPELLTPAETADVLRVGRRAVYGLVERGELRHLRLGSGPRARIRIPTDALNELERAFRSSPRSKPPAERRETSVARQSSSRAHAGLETP